MHKHTSTEGKHRGAPVCGVDTDARRRPEQTERDAARKLSGHSFYWFPSFCDTVTRKMTSITETGGEIDEACLGKETWILN
ncbi:hypothetical protein EVAR_57557_1 [Eumeta japonica]|uniref:Uncharacterized protein n=1 Tax=Eumeta variegata TaxID=151549 RepID=A0A4C2A311_EUMVA|nr:hypothetical protein EVAR_57557_1 [Eumeta japonica]